MMTVGLRSLEWLASIQRSDDGYFAPIGSNGFYRRNHPKASFDQQPVEACAMVSACLSASRATGDRRWAEHALRAFNWFLGQNQLQQALYDATTGGCRDGLHVDRVNENQGAESTLSFLLALAEMRLADQAAALIAPVRGSSGVTAGRGYQSLFRRHANNPILTAADWPYPAHSVFNAGATLLRDGTTLLLCRVEDRRGFSHLCAARSANGVDGWVIDAEPTLATGSRALSRGALGDRGSSHHVRRRARQVCDRVYGLQQGRSGRGARPHRGLSQLRAHGLGHAARRQGCRRVAPSHRRAASRSFIGRCTIPARTCGSRTRRISATGAVTSCSCKRAKADGGTPTRSGFRRR